MYRNQKDFKYHELNVLYYNYYILLVKDNNNTSYRYVDK